MDQEEALKKYQVYDAALSQDQRFEADLYKKRAAQCLSAALASALLVTIGAEMGPTTFFLNLNSWLIFIGFTFATISLGLMLIFSGKNILLRKYVPGTWSRSKSPPLFGDSALSWGRASIFAGYVIILFFILSVFVIMATILFTGR